MPSLTAAFLEAFNRGDVEAAGEYCTDDALMLVPGRTPIKGRTAIETGEFVTVYRRQADGSRKIVVDSLIRDTA
jgi:ketosteroid isomerase-like protein